MARHQNQLLRLILWWIIGLSLSLHIVTLLLGHTTFADWRWIHLPVHAAAEMSGSVIALIVVWFLYSLHRRGQGTSYNLVIACALIAMGILDGMHALENEGKIFVWLHSIATAAGGTFFALIWLPRDLQSRLNGRWLLAVLGTTLAFGSVSMLWPEWIPAMVEEGKFTVIARTLNLGGGVLMLAAAVKLFLTYQDWRNTDDLLFCLHCTLFGAAAIMFEQSALWDLPWWGWHALRLLAYSVALWFVLLADLRAQQALQESQVELGEAAATLEKRIDERTEILRRRESESRTIIEASPNGMIIANRKGLIVRLNEAAASLFGYEPKELVGMPIELLVPHDLREQHRELREGYHEEQEARRMGAGRDLEGLRKDRTTIPIEISLNPIETSEGPQVLASIVDLTERIRADEELQLITNRLMLATKAGGIGVWDYDVVTKALVWDDDMYRIYGISPERFSGAYEAWEGVLHPDDKEEEAEKLQRAIRGEEDFDTEFRVIWPDDGSIHFIKAYGTVIRDESGAAIRMIGVNWDNTERKKYEDKLHAAKLEAEAAAQAKSEFLANMSHEIRTPMNGIMGMTELLLGTELRRDQREYLNLVRHSAESLLTVINDILDFSKIEAGKLQLDPYQFDLRDSIGNTLQTLSLKAEEKELELAYRVQSDVPDRLLGDPGRIRQILVNLVGNAIKFTAKGEIVVDVLLDSSTREHVSLHFMVKDSGIGISQDKLRTIFESFTQAESSTTRTYGGTGLGLTISKRLVELMKGRLWVESEPGKGSTFHFTVVIRIGSEESKTLSPVPETLNGLRVLIVDDNATNRKILNEMLRNWEMAPQCVSSGPEALQKLATAARSEPFQLVLLDVMMPDMNGVEVASRIQEHYGESAPGIFALTSGLTMAPEQISNSGIDRVLPKPVKQSDLLDAITRFFGSAKGDENGDACTAADRPEGIRPMRILLAEDGRVNQIVATNLLEARGHSVALARDGQAAIEMFEREPFDAILMDVQMPTLDGYAATAIIRNSEKKSGRHIPIIAMTANAMKGDREKCITAGMDDYVAKPVRSSELFAVLEQFAAAEVTSHTPHGKGVASEPSPIPPTDDETDLFDAERFRNDLRDPDLMRKLIDLFEEDTTALLDKTRRALAATDANDLHVAAHSLKGLLGNYQAKRALQAAAHLDQLARNNELIHAREAINDCAREVARLNSRLQNFRDSINSSDSA